MEYIHDQFPYPPQHPRQQLFYHPGPYTPFPQPPPQQLDEYYMTYGQPEYVDFVPHGPFQEEYEDVGEVPTRPRLTKEQVGVLEAQFQANHKPNSVVKRQLAMQTNLSLPRVANWFQNRRAKAKQQKKQEEFEITQSLGPDDPSHPDRPADGGSANVKNEDDQDFSDDENFLPQIPVRFEAEVMSKDPSDDAAKEAGWASLQRALNAAKSARPPQQAPAQTQIVSSMPPSQIQHESVVSTTHVGMPNSTTMQMPHAQNFSRKHSWADAWTSQQVFHDQGFNFGFGDQAASAAYSPEVVTNRVPQSIVQETCVVSPDTWQDALPTPRGLCHSQLETGQILQSPDLPQPAYPGSRRGSGADDLTNNFDAFALAGDSPHNLTTPVSAMPIPHPDGHLDLAARRKRPRPAALTSASLRSRSYGAMTSMSPTLRPSITPPAHCVRHVKSTGQSLNARYSGIRKPFSAQRSPINVSTFAEAEVFNRLMAQQVTAAQTPLVTTAESSGPLLSPALVVNGQASVEHGTNPMAQQFELASRYQLPNTQHLTLMTASPPTTPFTAEFDPNTHATFGMPPVSAPPQYASFPDYTPPYSAGPLTNSSWSDAPLTSPDVPTFPPVTYIPSLGHPQKSETIPGHFQEFVLASDSKSEMDAASSTSEQKKTDFVMQEFPNQKEEHAHVARQLAQHRPKNYVFANTAQSDYDQS